MSGPGAVFKAWDEGQCGCLQLKWTSNADSDIAGYTIYYGFAAGSYVGRARVVHQTGAVQYFNLRNLTTANVPYFIALAAYDKSGNQSALSAPISANPDPSVRTEADAGNDTAITPLPPPAPGAAAVATPADNQLQVSWTKTYADCLTNAVFGYRVYRSANPELHPAGRLGGLRQLHRRREHARPGRDELPRHRRGHPGRLPGRLRGVLLQGRDRHLRPGTAHELHEPRGRDDDDLHRRPVRQRQRDADRRHAHLEPDPDLEGRLPPHHPLAHQPLARRGAAPRLHVHAGLLQHRRLPAAHRDARRRGLQRRHRPRGRPGAPDPGRRRHRRDRRRAHDDQLRRRGRGGPERLAGRDRQPAAQQGRDLLLPRRGLRPLQEPQRGHRAGALDRRAVQRLPRRRALPGRPAARRGPARHRGVRGRAAAPRLELRRRQLHHPPGLPGLPRRALPGERLHAAGPDPGRLAGRSSAAPTSRRTRTCSTTPSSTGRSTTTASTPATATTSAGSRASPSTPATTRTTTPRPRTSRGSRSASSTAPVSSGTSRRR